MSDYRRASKCIIAGCNNLGHPANTTGYYPAFGGVMNNVVTFYQEPIAYGGTLRRLYIHTQLAPGAGQTVTLTVFVNGVATALTATIADAAVDAADLVNNVPIAEGQRVNVQIVTSVGSAAQPLTWGFRLD